jgi:hypothetical protein
MSEQLYAEYAEHADERGQSGLQIIRETYIIAHTIAVGEQGMSELFALEAGRRVAQLWKRIVWMFESVSRQRRERL